MNIEGERKLEYGKSKMEGEKSGRVWETKVRVFMWGEINFNIEGKRTGEYGRGKEE